MNINSIIERIKSLGFTTYEAKAYVALLQTNPVTRYELSRNSGVPRSAIYDIIRKLEGIGAVNAMSSDPVKYVPLPPQQLFELLERQFKDRLSEAYHSLSNLNSEPDAGYLWNILGYKNMLHKASEMITKAHSTIFISLWERECQLLKKDLEAAVQRGVQIIAFSFTSLDIRGAKIYSYHVPESKLEKIWDHKLILVIDQNELLMGEADNKNNKKTAWTTNQAIVDIATNHLILDITLYGLRMNIDVGSTVLSMQNTGFENLEDLLRQYASIPNNIDLISRVKG